MDILFLGGDKRYKFIMDDLSKNHSVYQIGFKGVSNEVHSVNLDNLSLSKFDVVLFPISGINDNFEIKTELRKFEAFWRYI